MLTMKYPDAIPDQRYSINDTATLLGIHRNTLKKYTDLHFIKFHLHSVGRRVFYLGKDINEFWNKTITR